MPKNHARKIALSGLKDSLGIRHADAVALLDHPDADERATLREYLATYVDINTYRGAVDYLVQERNDPRNQLLCDTCGWSVGMICPECPGCGCYTGQCSGWRHHEYSEPDYDDPDYGVYCRECGAGSSSPYDECTCFEDEESDGQEPEAVPAPAPEPLELASPGGWGTSSGPFPGGGGWGV
jgi:hypothetical protein